MARSINKSRAQISLHEAINKLDIDIALIRTLLAQGADLSVKNDDDYTPIVLAAKKGHWNIVKLIAKSFSTDNEDKAEYGRALLRAASAKRPDVVKALLDANTPDNKWFRQTALHHAVINNDKDSVEALCNAGVDRTIKNSDGHTPIMLAAEKGHWEVVKLFAKYPTNDEDKAKYDRALLLATRAKQTHVVKALLAAKVPCSWRDKLGNTALHHAIITNNSDLVEALCNAGADLTDKNTDGHTPIVLAAHKGHWEIVKLLAANYPTDNKDNAEYGRALLKAVIAKQTEIAKLLIDAKAHNNKWSNVSTDNTALHYAIINNDIDLVKALCNAGADLTDKNTDGHTPIVLAAHKGHWEIVKLLAANYPTDSKDNAEYGRALLKAVIAKQTEIAKLLIDAKAHNSKWSNVSTDNTALHYAIINNDIDLVKALCNALCNAGADLTDKNTDGHTPIVLAAHKGHWEIVKLLAKYATDKEDKANYGRALLRAATDKKTEIAILLLEANADASRWANPSTRNTALHYAVINNDIDLVKALYNAGANLTAKNTDGKTPLDLAIAQGNQEIIKIFPQPQEANQLRIKFEENSQLIERLLKDLDEEDFLSTPEGIDFMCPISCTVFTKPVYTIDTKGNRQLQIYEEENIQRWLNRIPTDPQTRIELKKEVIPAIDVQEKLITVLKEQKLSQIKASNEKLSLEFEKNSKLIKGLLEKIDEQDFLKKVENRKLIICPISNTIITKPVFTLNDACEKVSTKRIAYEKEQIETWLKNNSIDYETKEPIEKQVIFATDRQQALLRVLKQYLYNKFIQAYHQNYNSSFFKNPYSNMKTGLEKKSISNFDAVQKYVNENPKSRSALILKQIMADNSKTSVATNQKSQ